jgi:hypothetical protein
MTASQQADWLQLIRAAEWGIGKGRKTLIVDLSLLQAVQAELECLQEAKQFAAMLHGLLCCSKTSTEGA